MPNKEKTRKAFSKAAPHYNKYAHWQQEIGQSLIAKINTPPAGVLDVGCGTGQLLFKLSDKYPETECQGIDIAEGMIQVAQEQSILQKKPEIIFQIGDMEKIDFPAESFELVISNLAYQWAENTEKCFSETARVLKTEGQLICTTLGQGSLRELQRTYQSLFRNNKHLHTFQAKSEVSRILRKYFFKVNVEEKETVLYFPDFKSLAQSIRKVGAKAQGSPFLGKTDLLKLEKNYPKTKNGLPLTYRVLFINASHPKIS